MLIARYARRNLQRQHGRSALTVVAVMLAVGLTITGNTLIDGLLGHLLDEFTVNTGHIRLRHPEYDRLSRFDPLDYTVDRIAERAAELERVEQVTAVAPRIRFGVMLQYTDSSTIVPERQVEDESELTDEQIFGRKVIELSSALAVDPVRERRVSRTESQLTAGTWFSGQPGEILLGVELARRLGVKVGTELELVSFKGGVRDATARVAGIFDAGNNLLNRGCFVPLALAQSLLDLPDQATQLAVFGEDLFESDELAVALAGNPGVAGLALSQWNTMGLMRTLTQMVGIIFGSLGLAIFVVAVAGLLNTMLMNVLERRREIGVLLALGLARRRIVGAILLEAAFLALIGCAAGLLLGLAAGGWLVEHGIELGKATLDMPIAVGSVVYGKLTGVAVARAVALGFVTAIVGALWPALKASALDPTEAMRRR